MAQIELDALERLDIQAWRTEDEQGDVTLIIKTDDGTVRIQAGRTADDADRLAEALTKAAGQAIEVGDNWDERPDENALYVSLDRGRYYVSWGSRDREGQPRDGYPTEEIALYEAAAWQAEAGEFGSAWMTGEHGPSTRDIVAELHALQDEHDKVRPLPGVTYEDGAMVTPADDDWPTWVVDRDYGAYGVMIHTEGDPAVTALAQHSRLARYWWPVEGFPEARRTDLAGSYWAEITPRQDGSGWSWGVLNTTDTDPWQAEVASGVAADEAGARAAVAQWRAPDDSNQNQG